MGKTPLCDLAYKYGSDKCPEIKHNYTEFYYNLLLDRKDSINKLMEIGIGTPEEMGWTDRPDYITGASLRMWRDFLPNALIYGVDILPQAMFSDTRIKTFQSDQKDEKKLKEILLAVGNDLDILIEDGSHKPEDQIFTCKVLMPLLKKDVIYLIEDVGHGEIIDSLTEYNCEFARLPKRDYKDDRILIVRHKDV